MGTRGLKVQGKRKGTSDRRNPSHKKGYYPSYPFTDKSEFIFIIKSIAFPTTQPFYQPNTQLDRNAAEQRDPN